MSHVIARQLVIDNFKSFGRRTVIPFMEGFTTISGPNGSGKSNLLDSILFTLGLSTSKGMRAERLPDLINTRSQRREARVTLTLWIPDESRELSISRVVRQSRDSYSSTYYVDSKPATLQGVHEVLAELNVSPKGYNIVMQGDVTRLLSMSPVERRRILDEMAGVAEFDSRIESARKELDQAEHHIENTRILQGELTSRLTELEQERSQALAYLALRDERDRMERAVVKRKLHDLEKSHEVARRRMSDVQADREARAKGLQDLEREHQERRRDYQALDLRIQEISEKDRLGGFAELEEVRASISKARTYSEYVLSLATENTTRRDELIAKCQEMEGRQSQLAELIRTDESEQRQLESVLAQRRGDVEQIHDRLRSMTDESTRTLQDLPALRRRREEILELVTSLGYEEARIAQQMVQGAEDLAKSGERSQVVKGELDGHTRAVEARSKAHKEVSTKVSDLTYQLLDQRSGIKAQKNRLYELEESYRNQYREYTRLEERHRATQEIGGNAALEAVLKSGIQGLHGRVLDLIRIPEEYQLALEAAAGRKLEFLVVKDEDVATEAIHFLKQRRLGRMTFLPLTKVRGLRPTESVHVPGVIGWAVDLVSFDAKYTGIVAFVFGSTLVIDRIETGLPMIGRHRMVSLDGDLLERSGAMTGGSAPEKRRHGPGAGQLVVLKRTLDEIEREAREIRKQIPEMEEALTRLEETIGALKKEESGCGAELAGSQREAGRLKDEMRGLEAAVVAAEKNLETLARDQQSFRKEIDKGRLELGVIEQELAGRESLLEQSRMGEISEEMRFADGRVREQAEALSRVRERLKERQLERDFYQKTLTVHRKEIREIEDKIVTLLDQAEAHDHEAATLAGREIELRDQLAEISRELGTLKETRDEAARGVEELVERREAQKAALEEILRAVRELELKEEALRTELGELAARVEAEGLELPVEVPRENVRDLERTLAGFRMQMDQMGAVNLLAIDQYAELEARLGALSEKLQTLDRERHELLARMTRFETQKRDAFMETFEGVRAQFVKVYQELSDGEGELVLEHPADPFQGGLIIKARPRNKKMERIEALSGGEKSLAALGFVFAFQSFRPAPFYIFDEVDMFLDNPNTERLARMIRKQARNTQFIVVSLKRSMIEKSQQTIGVFSREGGHTQAAGLEIAERDQFMTQHADDEPSPGPGRWN